MSAPLTKPSWESFLPKNVLVLAGPTASGKTEVARWIARKIPVTLISFDSMQVYRRMPVTTQAPANKPFGPKTRLVNFLDPRKEYSAAQFRADAEPLVRTALKKGKTPLLIGGTGLYLKALLDGLFEESPEKPLTNGGLRQKWLKAQAEHGKHFLHCRLKELDPASAEKIHPNDTRRLARALEICQVTGQPYSSVRQNRRGLRAEFETIIFFLDRRREDLYDRINRRVDGMIRQGLVTEVKRLSRNASLSRTAGMALGVREITAYLKGEMKLAAAVELLKKHTRNYAKRQISWFRHEAGTVFIPMEPRESSRSAAEKILAQWKRAP